MSDAAVPIPWPDSGDAAERLHERVRAPDVLLAISALRRYGDEIRAQGLAGAERHLRGLSPDARGAVDTLAARIVDRFLLVLTLRLQEAAAAPDGSVYVRAVQELFRAGEGRR